MTLNQMTEPPCAYPAVVDHERHCTRYVVGNDSKLATRLVNLVEKDFTRAVGRP